MSLASLAALVLSVTVMGEPELELCVLGVGGVKRRVGL